MAVHQCGMTGRQPPISDQAPVKRVRDTDIGWAKDPQETPCLGFVTARW